MARSHLADLKAELARLRAALADHRAALGAVTPGIPPAAGLLREHERLRARFLELRDRYRDEGVR